MGMYSSTLYCDLRIKDGKKKEFLDWLKKHPEYEEITKIDEEGNVEIKVDGWKIISYWYENFLDELEELNQFLEGSWTLIYETYDEMAIIEFGDKVRIRIGVMEFEDLSIEDLRAMHKNIERVIKNVYINR